MSAEAWEDMRAYNTRLEERAREAERALGEMREAATNYRLLVRAPFAPNEDEFEKWFALLGEADSALSSALCPSEDTSDES